MLKYLVIRLSLLWLTLIMLIGATLWIAPRLPSKGTLLLTHNVFLNDYDRFEFYDISRGLLYGFTPDLGEDIVSASLAPNGRYIAVVSIENGQTSLDVITLSGQSIIETIRMDSIRLGSWSPDSNYFSYSDNFARVFIVDIISDIERLLTNQGKKVSSPSWSADSQQIAFAVLLELDEQSQIWIGNANGINHSHLSNVSSIPYCLIWSSDGQTIAYFERIESRDQLQFMALDGTISSEYPSSEWYSASCPSWSANGRYISLMAFLTDGFTTDIVLLDVFTGEAEIILEVEQTTNIQWWR